MTDPGAFLLMITVKERNMAKNLYIGNLSAEVTKEDLLDMIALKLGKTYKELLTIIEKF